MKIQVDTSRIWTQDVETEEVMLKHIKKKSEFRLFCEKKNFFASLNRFGFNSPYCIVLSYCVIANGAV